MRHRRPVCVSSKMTNMTIFVTKHDLATAAMRRAIMQQGREGLLPPKYQKIFDAKHAGTADDQS